MRTWGVGGLAGNSGMLTRVNDLVLRMIMQVLKSMESEAVASVKCGVSLTYMRSVMIWGSF